MGIEEEGAVAFEGANVLEGDGEGGEEGVFGEGVGVSVECDGQGGVGTGIGGGERGEGGVAVGDGRAEGVGGGVEEEGAGEGGGGEEGGFEGGVAEGEFEDEGVAAGGSAEEPGALGAEFVVGVGALSEDGEGVGEGLCAAGGEVFFAEGDADEGADFGLEEWGEFVEAVDGLEEEVELAEAGEGAAFPAIAGGESVGGFAEEACEAGGLGVDEAGGLLGEGGVLGAGVDEALADEVFEEGVEVVGPGGDFFASGRRGVWLVRRGRRGLRWPFRFSPVFSGLFRSGRRASRRPIGAGCRLRGRWGRA